MLSSGVLLTNFFVVLCCVRPGAVSRGAPESPGQDRQVAADPRRQADQVLPPQLRQARPLQTQTGPQWKKTCFIVCVFQVQGGF